jgi:putative peptide zinc metalloprotease protein
MPDLIEENTPLPQFRSDLRLHKGPDARDGSPTYNLQDPVKGKYFQLTWAESLIFKKMREGMTLGQLVDELNNNTTLSVSTEQVKEFLNECLKYTLLKAPMPSEHFTKLAHMRKMGWFKWVLYNYLFMRIPLGNPDRFLTRTLPYVKFFGSNFAFAFYGLICLTGITLLFLKFGEFVSGFSFFFNLEGFIDYSFAIFIVKVVHEFSHAYAAKRYGVYVPSMGIAFIVLWPVLYTDVTDGWKLQNRQHRLLISAAGVLSESIIAGICTIGWALTQPGVLNNIFFIIASVTWVSTLVVNLNPAIRFDGYYMLCDIWGVDNLQTRTFAVTRWKFREWLLGLYTPCPEPRLSFKQQVGYMGYALYTIIYRLFLYTAIALFVYHTFTKALGIFLFFVEIGIFILWPLAWEIMDLKKHHAHLTANIRSMTTIAFLLLFLGWAILPLPHTLFFPGVVVPIEEQNVYVPHDSVVREIFIKRGDAVVKGQPLIRLVAPNITFNLIDAKNQVNTLQKEVELLGYDDTQLSYIPQKQAELEETIQKVKGLENINEDLYIRAQVSGQVHDWDKDLYVGQAVAKDRILGKVANVKDVEVVGFIPEADLENVTVGQPVRFIIYSTGEEVKGNIKSINPVRPQFLSYPSLASIYKGQIPVNEEQRTEKLSIIDAYYTVWIELEPTQTQLFFGKTGEVETRGPWRSKIVELKRAIMSTLWREGNL